MNPFKAIGHLVAAVFRQLHHDHPDAAAEIGRVATVVVPVVAEIFFGLKTGNPVARETAIATVMRVAAMEGVAWGSELVRACLELAPPRIVAREMAAALYIEDVIERHGLDHLPAVHTIETIVQTGYEKWKDDLAATDDGATRTSPLDGSEIPGQ